MIFLGTRLGLRKRPTGRTRCTACTRVIARARCLRPQAEFARASGRGLRRVKNVVQDTKGMCKKNDSLLCCFFVPFLACPRKVTQRRAPGENSLRHARSSSVHFGNSPFGLRQSEMLHPRTLSPG